MTMGDLKGKPDRGRHSVSVSTRRPRVNKWLALCMWGAHAGWVHANLNCKVPTAHPGYYLGGLLTTAPYKLLRGQFNVTGIVCAEGYEGSARAVVCPAIDTPFTLRGCVSRKRRGYSADLRQVMCSIPSPQANPSVAAMTPAHAPSLNLPELGLPDLGVPPLGVTTVDGLGDLSCASGFAENKCRLLPGAHTGYAVEKSPSDTVPITGLGNVTCDTGYIGTATVHCHAGDTPNFTFGGCTKISCLNGSTVNGSEVACPPAIWVNPRVRVCLRCGAAVCEYAWTGISGTEVADLTSNSRYPDEPHAITALTSGSFQMRQRGDNLGAMLEGFMVAPTTGAYTFSTRSDDSSEVWAAPQPDSMADLKKVVELSGCCRKVMGSTKLSWIKGMAYYIKALVKEGIGGEYLYVGTKVGGKEYYPIPISMFKMIETCSANVTNKGMGSGCSHSLPCGVCEGDCDSDGDCQGALKCFQRTDQTAVPNCAGLRTSGWDYCYNASHHSSWVEKNNTCAPPKAAAIVPTSACNGEAGHVAGGGLLGMHQGYSNGRDCAWNVTCPNPSQRVWITFEAFQLHHSSDDYVELQHVAGAPGGVRYAQKADSWLLQNRRPNGDTRTVPPPRMSSITSMVVRFKSDTVGTAYGFVARASCMDLCAGTAKAKCSTLSSCSSGFVKDPSKYSTDCAETTCTEATDTATCCSARAKCATLRTCTAPKVKDSSNDNVDCAGTPCSATVDTDTCCGCQAGHTLKNNVCAANVCSCQDGTPAVATGTAGTLCETNGTVDCSACNAGHTLTAPAGPGLQSCTHTTCDGTVALANGAQGDCSATMAKNTVCQPVCHAGFIVSGQSTCSGTGVYTAATCAARAQCSTLSSCTGTKVKDSSKDSTYCAGTSCSASVDTATCCKAAPPAAAYVKSTGSGCPAGSQAITTAGDCRAAAKLLTPAKAFGRTENLSIYPMGCYNYPRDGKAYFNSFINDIPCNVLLRSSFCYCKTTGRRMLSAPSAQCLLVGGVYRGAWQEHADKDTIFVDVSTAAFQLTTLTPAYVISLRGGAEHWLANMALNRSRTSQGSFRLMLSQPQITAQLAAYRGYRISWVAAQASCGGAGTTPLGNTSWQNISREDAVFVAIDTSAAGFAAAPVYVVQLSCDHGCWSGHLRQGVYAASASGFKLYIHKPGVTAAAARSDWQVSWLGTDDPKLGARSSITAWAPHDTGAVTITVDTTSRTPYPPTTTPEYFSTLHCARGPTAGCGTQGSASVYFAAAAQFSVYVQASGLTADRARNDHWSIHWIAIHEPASPVATERAQCAGESTPESAVAISVPVQAVQTKKFSAAVLASNGKVYLLPCSAADILVIDARVTTPLSSAPPLTSWSTLPLPTSTGSTAPSGCQWSDGVLAPNGRIYGIPSESPAVLIITPDKNRVDTGTIAGLAGTSKWRGGCLAANGKIYGMPYQAGSVLEIDPKKEDITRITSAVDQSTMTSKLLSALNVGAKWDGAVLSPSGLVYGIPSTSSSVLVVDPTMPVSAQLYPASTAMPGKWSGGVLAPNGKIYCIPHNADTVLVIDTTATPPTISTKPILFTTGSSASTAQWSGGVLAPNGMIYAAPSSRTRILMINPNMDSELAYEDDSGDFDSSLMMDTAVTTDKWSAGALLPDGTIVFAPSSAQHVLRITPWKREFTFPGACTEMTCKTNNLVGFNVSTRAERSLQGGNLTVEGVKCEASFSGKAEIFTCRANNTPYVLQGCNQMACRRPTNHTGYNFDAGIVREVMWASNFSVNGIKCQVGYGGMAQAHMCTTHEGEYTLSGCVELRCRRPATEAALAGYDNASIIETSLSGATFDVKATCATGYASSDRWVQAGLCSETDSSMEYTLQGCSEVACIRPVDLTGYNVLHISEVLQGANFIVNGLTCAENYDGQPAASVCSVDKGMYKLSGCRPSSCSLLRNTPGYTVEKTPGLGLKQFSPPMPDLGLPPLGTSDNLGLGTVDCATAYGRENTFSCKATHPTGGSSLRVTIPFAPTRVDCAERVAALHPQASGFWYRLDAENRSGTCSARLRPENSAVRPASGCEELRFDGVDTDGQFFTGLGSHAAWCDMEYKAGGWTLLMKATRGNTFEFNSTYWTQPNVLNADNPSLVDEDAKYSEFNVKTINRLMAYFPETRTRWNLAMDVPQSALSFFARHRHLNDNLVEICGSSCNDIKIAKPFAKSGVFSIKDPEGTGSINVFCDMEDDDGGWTLVYKIADASDMRSTDAVNPICLTRADRNFHSTTSCKLSDAVIRSQCGEQYRVRQWGSHIGPLYCKFAHGQQYVDNATLVKLCGTVYAKTANYSTVSRTMYGFSSAGFPGATVTQAKYADNRLGSLLCENCTSNDTGCTGGDIGGGCHTEVWCRAPAEPKSMCARHANWDDSVFSRQDGHQTHDISLDAPSSAVRWGYSWNVAGNSTSSGSHVQSGIGLGGGVKWSAGDFHRCCGVAAPLGDKSMRVHIYGKFDTCDSSIQCASYFAKSRRALVRGTEYATVSLPVEFDVSVDIAPNANVVDDWTNVIHLTTADNCCNHGSRVPAVWLHPNSRRLRVSDPSLGLRGCDPSLDLPVGRFTTLRMAFRLQTVRVYVNGTLQCTMHRTNATGFDAVRVFASDPWHSSADSSIRNFWIRRFQQQPSGGVTFEAYPLQTDSHTNVPSDALEEVWRNTLPILTIKNMTRPNGSMSYLSDPQVADNGYDSIVGLYAAIASMTSLTSSVNYRVWLRWRGQILIERPGSYTFRLTSKDGSMLYLDSAALLNHNSMHSFQSTEKSVKLSKGLHDLVVSCVATKYGMELAWKDPLGSRFEAIPFSSLTAPEPRACFCVFNSSNTVVQPPGQGQLASTCTFSNRPQAVCSVSTTTDAVLKASPGFAHLDSAAEKFSGGVLHPNGRIYTIPFKGAEFIYILDWAKQQYYAVQKSDKPGFDRLWGTAQGKWKGGVLAPDGKIYCIPFSKKPVEVLVISPDSRDPSTIKLTTIPQYDSEKLENWDGGVLALSGKIYGMPFRWNAVLEIDPIAGTARAPLCPKSCLTTTRPGTTEYATCCTSGEPLALPPCIGMHKDNETNTVTGAKDKILCYTPDPWANKYKWSGGVLAPDGRIFAIPRTARAVLIIDPTPGALRLDYTSLAGITNTKGYSGGVLASNGKIYGIPYGANTVLVIDPITMSYDVTTIAIGHAASAWSGGVLAPNGDIYAIPYTATSVLIIDTERNQTDIEPIYGVSVGMQKQWDGGVLVSDGTMFGIPASADSLLRIAPQIRTFVFRGCQGICPNNTYGNGNGTCFRCPPHSTTNGSTGWSTKSACTCVPGTFDDGHTCSLCQPNTFAFAAGQSSCTDCPNHTYTNESSGAHMCECKPGTESHVPPGWTVVLKSDGDATFAYDAPMWTDTSVFNVDSDPTQAGNAKYPGYNEFSFDAVTACVHTLDNCLTPHEFSVPIGSASTLFGDNHRSIGKSGTNTSRNDFIGVMKPNIRRQAGEVEAGTITVGDRMTNVYFSGPKFVNPVVILGIASRNSHVEIVPRITRITGTGFDVYIDVPNHAEGVGPYCGTTAHAAETLSWAVAESGDAEHLRAGTIDSASDFQWKAVSFGTAFTSVPIIVSQIQTHRDDDWVTTRHKNVSVIGFEVRMEEDGLDTTHPREMIGWFAVPIGNSTAYGRTFEGVLIPSVSHHPTVINFQSSFSSVPTLFGSIFTERSQDPAHLRQHNTAISTRNATIFIEEEGCSDADMQHSEAEAVHILIIGHSKGSGRDCPAQRFGFNTYCNADLKVRWGYCGDRPIDPCQFDSEYTTLYSAAIGFGLSRDVGAGYTHSFVNNENIVQNNSRAQVWILVRNVPAANTTATCELCRVGTYKDVGGPSKCRSCPPFSSTISSGSTHATACICNAGFTMPGIVTQASNATCAACPHNFYKDQPGSGPCTPCPPHSTTASSVGAVSIAQCLCEAGYEGNVSLGSPCKPCEANTYKPSVGPQSCAACPWNSKTRTVGSTSIQSCICAEGFEVNMLYAGNGGLLDWGDHSAGSTVHTNWTSSLRRALGDSLSVEDCGALGSWLMTKSGPTAWRTLARTFDTRHVSHSALRIEIEVLAVDYLARSLRTRMFLNGQAIEATGTRTCSDVIAYNVSAVSGVYTLEINGVPTSVYCNVSSPRNGTYRPDIWALVYQTQGTSNMDTNSAVNATALAQSGLSGLRTSGKLSKGAIQLLCSRYKVTSSAQLPPINNNLPINETIISLKPYATHDSNRTIESNMQIWCQSDPLPMAAANATECYGATPQDVVRISTIARHSGAIANISLEVYSSKVGIRGMHITTGTMDGFDNSIDSWGSNVKPALRPAICGSLGPFLGGTRSMAGELVANTWVEKAFDVNSQPHDVVSLTLTVVALRAWGAGHVVVTADGLKIWTQKDFDGHSYQSCGDIRAKTIVLGPVDIPHNASVFTVRVAGSSHMAGSFAIDDVAVVPRLRWCTACQVGQYKTDRNNTGCTACPDYSTTASTTSVNLSSCTCLQGFTGDIVTDGDRCSILPKATIKTSGRNAPTVTVKWRSGISGGPPNLHKRLVLVSNISASGTVTLEWTAVQLAKENMVDLQNPKEVRLDGLSATALNVTIAPSPSGTISPLVIRPNSFTVAREQGMFCKTECGDGTAIYLFKLRATLVSDSSAWSEATVLVVMNPPPIGAVSIQPSSGQAVSTVFNLTATNWVDTDLPLTYEFFSASGTTSQGILAMHSSASNLAIALPQGDAKEDFKLAVGVRVTDSFEGVGQATTIATVTQFVLAPNADILSMADQFLAGTDTDSVATASRVNAFASTLMTIDTAKAKSVRDKLMDRLLTSVVNPSTDWTDSHTSACLAAAVTVTASAEQMSATATDQGLSLLTTMSSKITPSLASTAASTVSNLMAATEHAHNQTTKGTESPGEGRQQKASRDAAASRRSRALVSILDSITISLNAGRLPGEEPATIQTPKFQLEAHVMNSHTFEQKEPTRRRLRAAGGVSSLHVSRGALDEFSIGSAQIINWASTGNPHFWKGERMDAARPWAPSWNQPVKLATDVFTVSFFNATGGKMNISNLHKSAVVQLQGDSSLPNSSTVHCAFWETKQLRWKVDSIGKLLPDGTIECATTHFTDFAAFAGAPPQFNRLGKLSDLVHNPFGMRVVLFMVSAALLICVVAYLDYGRFIHNATSRKSSTRRKFDTRTSSFARISRLKNSPAVPWSSRAFIRMRTMWLPGGCCFAYEGDPYSRSNRLLLFVLHILVLLGVGILFFDGYTECTYPCDVGRYPNASEMPDECKVCLKEQDCSAENTSTATHAIVDSPSSRVCPETPETDALNNGFLTALLQCALVIPLIGVMNLWLAWLRQPLHANIMARSGEMLERIETKHFDEYHLDQVRKSRCSLCRDWCRSLLPNAKSCITVQIECICARCCRRNRTTLLVDGPSRNDDGSCLQDMPRNRAPACDRRRKVASQMRICEQTVDALWFRFDRNDDGVLDKEELSALMREVVGSSVTESDVDFVLAQADPTGGGLAEREQLKTAITLWRYLHHESDFVSAQFDSVDINSDGVLSLNEVGELLTILNDGMPPTLMEVEWVMKQADENGDGSLDGHEVRAAVALWYPAVYNRRWMEDLSGLRRAPASHRRKAISAQLGLFRDEAMQLVARGKRLRKAEGEGGNNAKRRKKRKGKRLYQHDVTRLMADMSDGNTPSQRDVDMVLMVADCSWAESFAVDEIVDAVAMWKCLQGQEWIGRFTGSRHTTDSFFEVINTQIQNHDPSNSSVFDSRKVRQLLVALNDNHPVTPEETGWVIESSMTDSNTLDRDELRASIVWWYLRVPRTKIRPHLGIYAVAPYGFAAVISLLCAYLVARVSSQWNEDKTRAWIYSSGLALVLKLIVYDLGRTVFCTCLEPVIALFSPEICVSDSWSGLTQQGAETMGDILEDQTDDMAAAIAAGMNMDSVFAETDEKSDEQKRREQQNAVLTVGTLTAAKMVRKVHRQQARTKSAHAMTVAVRDHQEHSKRLAVQRSNSNALYAEKIAQKRLRKGMNRGQFAARAEVDMLSVTKYLGTKAHHHHEGGNNTGLGTTQGMPKAGQNPTDILNEAMHERDVHMSRIQRMQALKSSRVQERVMRRAGLLDPTSTPPADTQAQPTKKYSRTGHVARGPTRLSGTESTVSRTTPTESPSQLGRSASARRIPQTPDSHHSVRPAETAETNDSAHLDDATIYAMGMYRSPTNRAQLKVRVPPLPNQVTRHAP